MHSAADNAPFYRADVEVALEQACRRLALTDGAEDLVPRAVHLLATIAQQAAGGPGHVPAAFIEADEEKTREELGRLCGLAVRLQIALEKLPKDIRPAVVCSGRINFFRRDFPSRLEAMAHRAENAGLAARHRSVPAHARRLAMAIQQLHQPAIIALADLGLSGPMAGKPQASLLDVVDRLASLSTHYPLGGGSSARLPAGRRPNVTAHHVGLILGNIYFRLTETRPTIVTAYDPGSSGGYRRSGAWREFLAAAFTAMGISVGLEGVYREVAAKMRSQRQPWRLIG